jgi:hypothetical protein
MWKLGILVSLVVGLVWSADACALQANLSWTNGTGHTGIRIERQTDGAAFAVITEAPAHLKPEVVGYADTHVEAGHSYCYRVVTFGPGGDAPASNVSCGSYLTVPSGATGLQLMFSTPPPTRR